MGNISEKALRDIALAALAGLLAAAIWMAFVTYNHHEEGDGALMRFAVDHHLGIMVGLVLVSIVFGFASSRFLYARLQESRRASRGMLDVVLLFLSAEERTVVNYLVERGGETTQAEISRLPRMTRVKAHRSLQKMQEKRIVDLVPHGKMRRVVLKEGIRGVLIEGER